MKINFIINNKVNGRMIKEWMGLENAYIKMETLMKVYNLQINYINDNKN